MRQKLYLVPGAILLSIYLVACEMPTLSRNNEPLLTISEIQQDYAEYADQLVRVQGYGIIEAMSPLCPDHVGMDTRMAFVDAEGNNINARLKGDLWSLAAHQGELRDFLGYVRVFNDELGCPGSVGVVTFPYFEIVEVKGDP